MIHFLVIHTRYKDVQIGLYDLTQAIDIVTIDSKKMSKLFPQLIDDLLERHALTLSNLSFIAAHQGPAPFTTLRVSLSMTNALQYALHIPLIGIDGLNALLDEFQAQNGTVIALLNAFGKDLYYGIAHEGQRIYGCMEAAALIKKIREDYTEQPIYMIGNGVDLISTEIIDSLKDHVLIPAVNPELASIDAIAKQALIQWQKKEILEEIQPLYLKTYQPHVT